MIENDKTVTPSEAKPVKLEKASRNRKNGKKKYASKARKSTSIRPYPRVSLEKAMTIPVAVKEKNGGNAWAGEQLAKAVDLSPKNVAFYYLLLGAQKFNLTSGTKPDGEVSLSELGRQLVYSGSAEEELELKRKAFLSVDIFKTVLDYYGGNRLPEMQYLGNTLEDKFKLPPEFHEEFAQLFRQNCEYVGWGSGASPEAVRSAALGVVTPTHSRDVIVLGAPKNKTGLTCFVIMPFVEHTDQYSKGFFGEVLNSLIIPAATEAGFEVKTANRQGTEIIHSTIVNEVLNADLCVCDLTEHNPNVLFELGVRLAHEKPVALIHAEGTPRVFDVDNILRVLAYKKELWRTTLQKDIPDLTMHIKATWENRDTNETYLRTLRKQERELKAMSAKA